MSAVGRRLRHVAARVCDGFTLTHVVEPAIADLQMEVAAARRRGREWSARWTRVTGTLIVLLVIARAASTPLELRPSRLTDDERLQATRMLRAFIVALCGAIATTIAVTGLTLLRDDGHLLMLLALLVPSQLPVALPLAMAVAALARRHDVMPGRRMDAALGAAAVVAALASVAMMAWLVPAANLSFRELRAGYPVLAGMNEITLPELHRHLAENTGASLYGAPRPEHLALAVHSRWAMAVAVLTMTWAGVLLAKRSRRARWTGAVALVVLHTLGYLVFMRPHGGVPPLVQAWLPNTLLACLCLWESVRLRPERRAAWAPWVR